LSLGFHGTPERPEGAQELTISGSVEPDGEAPLRRTLVLRVDGKDRTLGATVANQVFVQKSA